MNYRNRRLILQKDISKYGVKALLLTHPIDLYYLTGFKLSAGQLIVKEAESSLYVDGRYFETCLEKNECPVFLNSENVLKEVLKKIGLIGIDSETTSLQAYLDLKKDLPDLKPIPGVLKEARMIKDQDELKLLRQAARLGCEGFNYVKSRLKVGIKESELAWELEKYWREKGAQGVAFEPIIAFQKNSAHPHYRASDTVLQQNSCALIDIGVKWQEYHSDMTRVIFVGEVDAEIKKIRSIVEAAVELVNQELKPGIMTDTLDRIARDYITAKGYGKYFTHSLGHGVGLAIHEPPFLRRSKEDTIELQENMVITIEPGIYVPQLGGVRLENSVIITNNGYENLTPIPYEIYL